MKTGFPLGYIAAEEYRIGAFPSCKFELSIGKYE
jgi:hypothetical protein